MSASRVKSATVRLQPLGGEKVGSSEAAKARVRSAGLQKVASFSLPEKRSRQHSRPVPDELRTQYDLDFRGSAEAEVSWKLRPPLRPSSPTRRNKPHPSETFLRWKIPVEELSNDPALMEEVKREIERDARSHFSHDYRELAGNDEKLMKSVLQTFTRLQLPPTETENSKYGRHTLKPSEKLLPEVEPLKTEKPTKEQIAVTRKSLERTTKKNALPALEAWLRTASPNDQHTVLSVIKSGEAALMNEQLQKIVKPSAVSGLEKWMDQAPHHERDVAMNLFDHFSKNAAQSKAGKSMARSNSLGLVGKKQATGGKKEKRTRSHTVPSVEMVGEPEIWHHRSIRDPQPRVVHRGSVFTQPKRYKGEHFSIHPEWPEYI